MSNETAVLDEMTEIELPQENSARAILSGIPDDRGNDLPSWFQSRQREAWARFASLPMPNRKDQPWRFSTVSALDLAPYNFAEAPGEDERAEILEQSKSLDQVAGRLIF